MSFLDFVNALCFVINDAKLIKKNILLPKSR